jgi:glycerol-3-phosphate dehydrogenase (NAD(P)+)
MKVAIIGTGAWGTAVAIHLARAGKKVLLWVYEEDLCDILKETRENSYYLPGFVLPEGIDFITTNEAPDFPDDVVIALPSFALRPTLKTMAPYLAGKRLLLLTKGLERGTLLGMSEVTEETIGTDRPVAVLSGPSFAREVAQGVFTAVVVGCRDKALAEQFQKTIHTEHFRVYTTDDVTGVELGGALKNVMAIGAGMIEGLKMGTNTEAAFTTRALAEIKRLGKAMGAREITFMGLSGIGDLILTSYGQLSRNRQFGLELSKGRKPDDILKSQRTVVEGYYTVQAAYDLSRKLAIEMPITEELYRILYEGKSIESSFSDITRRVYREEEY